MTEQLMLSLARLWTSEFWLQAQFPSCEVAQKTLHNPSDLGRWVAKEDAHIWEL